MRNGGNKSTPQALVDNVLQLISLPEIYLRLQKTIDDPMHTREQIADILSYDPSLAARVLRIANSSYYGFPSKIETVPAAVGIIGEVDLRNLVLATTVVGSMNSLVYQGVEIDRFWLHSLRCGIGARLIAKSVDGCNAEIMFLAGILHDLGILVIYQQDADLASAVARQIDQKHQLRDQAERELLGFDHAEVGALLIEAWGLTSFISQLVRCHHQFQLAKETHTEAVILSLANLLAKLETEVEIESEIRICTQAEQLGIGDQGLLKIIQTSEQQCAEVRSIILG